jgi:erythromycin esterase
MVVYSNDWIRSKSVRSSMTFESMAIESRAEEQRLRSETHPAPQYPTIDGWIRHESIAFSLNSSERFNSAVDKLVVSLGSGIKLLGFGEALHGGEDILLLRNRLFQRLVESHGYSAIAVESSFPRGRVVNKYVNGYGSSFDAIRDTGFSHGFGRLEANRELVEWMRRYNASHRVKLQFYGFDSPTEMTSTDSPRQLLQFVLDYLAAIDSAGARDRRQRVDELLGQDADWENPEAAFDPSKGIGGSSRATALRIETEELITELEVRRPELVAKSDKSQYLEAAHYAMLARLLLNYHAALGRTSAKRIVELLGIRAAMMAKNLAYMVSRERARGKVFAFAHNSHLKRGMARWQLGADLLEWWPAGAQLNEMLGSSYAVVGSGLGESVANGIGRPEAGTLEARLTTAPGPARLF